MIKEQQKQQILFLTKFYFPHVGGVEKHVSEIADRLISKKFSIIIITEQYRKDLPLFEKGKKLTIHRIPVPKSVFLKKFFIWKWFLMNFKIFKGTNIIHVHDIFYWILPFWFFIPKKKIFITFHGYEGFPIKKSWIFARKIAESLTQGNICVGNFMKKWYGTRPNFVIYGAVEAKKLKNNHFKKKSIIFFGRLDSQTNILEYTQGFKRLFKKDKKYSLDVFGDGELAAKLKKPIVVHNFNENVQGILYKYEYVFVSRYLSILEAMQSKKLVFAYYDNEIKKDYILDSPFSKYIISASSPKELALKVEHYSKSEAEKEEMIEKGYNFSSKQTWEKVVNTYLKLWFG